MAGSAARAQKLNTDPSEHWQSPPGTTSSHPTAPTLASADVLVDVLDPAPALASADVLVPDPSPAAPSWSPLPHPPTTPASTTNATVVVMAFLIIRISLRLTVSYEA